MSLTEAIAQCLRKYLDFSGRARRAEYWWWMLAITACVVILGVIAIALPEPADTLFIVVETLFILAAALPTVAVTTRRLHDIGKSGWWQLAWGPISATGWVIFWLGAILLLGSFLFAVFAGWGDGTAEVGLGIGFVFLLVGSVIALGTYIWMIAWLARQGDAGPNRFGPDPRAG